MLGTTNSQKENSVSPIAAISATHSDLDGVRTGELFPDSPTRHAYSAVKTSSGEMYSEM